jgi:hypothetical protein
MTKKRYEYKKASFLLHRVWHWTRKKFGSVCRQESDVCDEDRLMKFLLSEFAVPDALCAVDMILPTINIKMFSTFMKYC